MLRARVKTRAVWEILLRRNMTQNELAKKAGITSGHLSQLINGDRLPTPSVRKKLLDALAPIEFDDIFDIEEVPAVRGNGVREQTGPGDAGERATHPGAHDRTQVRQR